ncbi:hypothetical protein [Methylobacter psychrophilus]|uniref:hypothetical protein n=1 Tax=Methylobacter psychrophilus TaxID=96941 RepID=UPI0021D4AFDB|nr:hypothetical protein [Methylobacter psychrophilus]
MKPDDVDFLGEMVVQLDVTIRRLVREEHELALKLGSFRVQELKEFWNQELTNEEDAEFKRTLDYWEKILIRTWAHLSRAHKSRAQVGQTFMKLNSKL